MNGRKGDFHFRLLPWRLELSTPDNGVFQGEFVIWAEEETWNEEDGNYL
jgi:hypothetical protein